MLRPLDLARLRDEFATARPFPYVIIDNLIDPTKATEVAAAYPSFETALAQGRTFTTVNERKKIQISDSSKYSPPVAELNALLASDGFLGDLFHITGIPHLLADEQLIGGGIHMTGSGGRLDVHVDFNFIEDRKLHRRLNLLLYLNPHWEDKWGGQIQFWDRRVQHCKAEITPLFNRCVIFETNEISFHGVVPVSPEAPFPRKSFATYYYTSEAPAHWNGKSHGTIFKARPNEKMKNIILMPAESSKRRIAAILARLKNAMKKTIRW
jgi:hypothetical protein